MKAAIRRKYGTPDRITIQSVPLSNPNENEVVIKIKATTVNRTDCANLTAQPFLMRFVLGLINPKKIILGTDFAGEIVAIGKGVNSYKIGDRVFGFDDNGSESHAEYTTVTEENIFSIPDNIDYKIAAASLEGASYAYAFIKKVSIESGQKILINGATGAIGSALLQFARQHKDAIITATCNTSNIELIRGLGANKIIDYSKEDFTDMDEEYDFIFDAVGKSSFRNCKSVLKENGIYISSELGPYFQNLFYPLFTKVMSKKVIFPIPFKKKITIPFIIKLLKEGKFKPVIDREYLFEDISKAYAYVITGLKTGNVIINYNPYHH